MVKNHTFSLKCSPDGSLVGEDPLDPLLVYLFLHLCVVLFTGGCIMSLPVWKRILTLIIYICDIPKQCMSLVQLNQETRSIKILLYNRKCG